jgi:hypothetical protein
MLHRNVMRRAVSAPLWCGERQAGACPRALRGQSVFATLQCQIANRFERLRGSVMLSQKIFEELSNKISETIAASPVRDVEKNIRAMLASTFSKLDLVTREEFEVQQEVLARTREQLARLDARLARLEGEPGDNADTQASQGHS